MSAAYTWIVTPVFDVDSRCWQPAGALKKAHTRRLDAGSRVHSFQTLLHSLSALVRNKCRRKGAGIDEPTFDVNTTPNPKEQEAYNLLKGIAV